MRWFAAILFTASIAFADDPDWSHIDPWTPFGAALHGAELVTSSGISKPDGRYAVVTYWKIDANTKYLRCITHFDVDMSELSGRCSATAGFAPPPQ